jgi:hypothetical protein
MGPAAQHYNPIRSTLVIPATSSRRLTVFDSMVLLAALAPGLALLPGYLSYLHYLIFQTPPRFRVGILDYIVRAGVPFLYCLALALIALRLRQPRPPGSQLVRQPGFVACCMIALSAIVVPLAGIYPLAHQIVAGGLITGSWLILASTPRWAPEASWVECTGRLIGALETISKLLAGAGDDTTAGQRLAE